MGAAAVRLTSGEYSLLPESETVGCELVHGELEQMGNAGLGHEQIKSRLSQLFMAHLLATKAGQLYPETQFAIDSENVRQPDLSIVLRGRHQLVPRRGYHAGAPDLAVEIVSSEFAAQLEDKLTLYLAHGAKAVMIVYPEQRTVRMYYPSGLAQTFREADTLTIPDVLPGFSVQVAEIFESDPEILAST